MLNGKTISFEAYNINGSDYFMLCDLAMAYVNGNEVSFTGYNMGGNNYFKLRDIAKAIGFGVTWDGNANTIDIDTSTVYTE